jgi:hypothetical protein
MFLLLIFMSKDTFLVKKVLIIIFSELSDRKLDLIDTFGTSTI